MFQVADHYPGNWEEEKKHYPDNRSAEFSYQLKKCMQRLSSLPHAEQLAHLDSINRRLMIRQNMDKYNIFNTAILDKMDKKAKERNNKRANADLKKWGDVVQLKRLVKELS